MPTYHYRCDKCAHEFEIVQKMSEEPFKRCPSCKAMKLRRVFHPVGISFKGSGFYKTDYGSSKKPSDESKAEKQSEKKSDDKKSHGTKKSSDVKKPDKKAAPSE